MQGTGCEESPLPAYECLQGLHWQDVVNSIPIFYPKVSVDGQRSNDPMLPESPKIAMETGDFNQVSHVSCL